MTRRYGLFLACLLLLATAMQTSALMALSPVASSAPLQVTTRTESQPPTGLVFAVELPGTVNGEAVDDVVLQYQASDNPIEHLDIPAADEVRFTARRASVSMHVNLAEVNIPLGVRLTFHWSLTFADGTTVQTRRETAAWTDSNVKWDTVSAGSVTLHTTGISPSFTASMADQSAETLARLQKTYALDRQPRIDVWVYGRMEDFLASRPPNTREAIAGVSYPEYGVISAVIGDDDQGEYERVIPHELSHQMVYDATSGALAPVPLWLDEGLATHTQTGGTSGYAAMVKRASDQGTLFDITSLDASFPFGAAEATLAYASSWSAVTFITQTWGDASIGKLLATYNGGVSWAEATQQVFGMSPDDFNSAWSQWVAAQDL